MKKNTSINGLCFDDILLVPHDSSPISTRASIRLETKLGNPNNPEAILTLHSPIISAPMESISTSAMLHGLQSLGCIGMTERSKSIDEKIQQISNINKHKIGLTISGQDVYDKQITDKIVSSDIRIVLVDVANGHLQATADMISNLRSLVPNHVHIMCGNVSSYPAYKMLMDAGCDSVRVGIGGGAACTTRLMTGFGTPTLSSIMNIYENVKDDHVNGLVADGGIKNVGDAVKAFAAGARAVMLGSLLSGHDECLMINNKHVFRGLASQEYITTRSDWDKRNKILSFEGVSGEVQPKGPIQNSLENMLNSIRSAFSYAGAIDILGLQKEAEYVEVSSASAKESGSRI